MKTEQLLWTYKGVDVFKADANNVGIRWYARTNYGMLKTSSKKNMKRMINAIYVQWGGW